MFRFFKYHLPFKNHFKIATQELTAREGLIIVYEIDGLTAFGEAAPLPGFSNESIEQVLTILQTNKKKLEEAIINDSGNEILQILDQIHGFPSLSFGLNTLLLDLEAKQKNKTLHELIFESRANPVNTNFTLSISSEQELVKKVKNGIENGFETFKIKVGRNFLKERNTLEVLRNKFSGIKLRIDANQNWTAEEAIEKLNILEPFQIEYCEQPVPKDNIKGLKQVRNNTNIPIAADESVRSIRDVKNLIEQDAVDVLILKPMLFGLVEDIVVTKELADSHNIDVVITTALESIIGRTITAVIASGLGSRKFAHGLATGSLLAKDIADEKPVKKGVYTFSDQPGLGTSVKLNNLEEISV